LLPDLTFVAGFDNPVALFLRLLRTMAIMRMMMEKESEFFSIFFELPF
jgi:hypothetical protein